MAFRSILLLLLCCSASFAAEQPNIVMVFIDDMGWGDFSCFGNEDASTPNVDQLAAEGLRFTQFYVNSPICSASRCALTTGQYPQRWRITSYLNNRQDNNRRGVAQWLDPAAPSLAQMLHEQGYATGHFGKWHLGGQRDVDDAPPITTYGFDESLTNFEGMGAKLLPLTLKPGDSSAGRIWGDAERLGGPVVWMQRSEITRGFADAALAFIHRAKEAKKPFYINLWPDDVHSPYWPPVEQWGNGTRRELYLAVLEEMDRQFGRLFDEIRGDPALRDNTLILVCSDNGPDVDAGSTGGLRGTKATLYEGGIRSPLVVWGPGLIAKEHAGHANSSSVFAAFDLVPSLLSVAKVPVLTGIQFDGEDVSTTLLGRSDASRQAPICWRRPPDRKMAYGAGPLPDLAIREGDWKLLCEYDGSKPELYQLAADAAENSNVAAENSDIVQRLSDKVRQWNDSLPQDRGKQLGLRAQSQAVKPQAKKRPNIVFILADDLGYGDLGCYGQQLIETPRLDQMAAEGLRFTDFYAGNTVCAPSRCVLMTGRHMGHVHVRGNAGGPDMSIQSLRDEDVTVAEVLKSAGYTTGLCGKWGLGDDAPGGLAGLPRNQGFDFFYGYLNQVHAHNYYPEFLWRNDEKVRLGNVVQQVDRAYGAFRGGWATQRVDYSHDLVTRQALEFVRTHAKEESPFFLYLALTIPHANNEGTRGTGNGQEVPDYGIYADRDWPDQDKGQAAMITRMDSDVGRLLDLLKELGIDDNTVVMFSSDNGPHNEGGHDPARFNPSGPLRGMKRDLTEGGVRVPMIVRWPGKTPAGNESAHVGYFGDVMATVAELSGSTAPADIDSVSFVPTITGQPDAQQQHKYLYWEFYEQGGKQAVRSGKWKAVRMPWMSGKTQLYDLSQDIGETTDLAEQHPDEVRRMESIMAEAHQPHPNWTVRSP
jgi:uncharacterized sulfatase